MSGGKHDCDTITVVRQYRGVLIAATEIKVYRAVPYTK